MTPLAVVPEEAAKAIWFGLSVALLVVLVRMSVRTLPGRRRSERLARLDGRRADGQVLPARVESRSDQHPARRAARRRTGGGAAVAAQDGRVSLVGAGVFVKPYALILVPWLLFAAGISGLVAFAATFAGGAAPAGDRLRLVGQPRSGPRLVPDGHRHDRPEPARAGKRLGGDDVGQVARSRSTGVVARHVERRSLCLPSQRPPGSGGVECGSRRISSSAC